MNSPKKFAVACPVRSVCDNHARVFASIGRLQGHYLGTRRGSPDIPDEYSHRLPLVGLISYAAARIWPSKGETVKVACFPMFDRWVKRQLPDDTHVLSSYGYAVETFRKARRTGGMTFLDAGNSHPENFWSIVKEEHARWNVKIDPYPKNWNSWGLQSVELTDWIFSPSSYVTNSFIRRGFPSERILHLPYPVNLHNFSPEPTVKIPNTPIRVICTGGLSLRKGLPYLLEAMRLIRKERDAVLLLTEGVHPSMKAIFHKYSDVPIEWSPHLSHEKLGKRLKSAHVFALLSIEEGLARTALEAMACGIPVVLTPNTGVSDLVNQGINGEVVPIRDPHSAAESIVRCYESRINGHTAMNVSLNKPLSFNSFRESLLKHLDTIDSLGPREI